MSYFLAGRKARTKQPQVHAGINRSLPVGAALKMLINPAQGKLNLIDGASYSSAARIEPSPLGRSQLNIGYAATLSTAVSVPSGADFTAIVTLSKINTATGNNALFRSATGADTFCIIKTGGSGYRPWLRVNGTDVLNAASGPQVPTTRPVTIVFSWRSGKGYEIAWDGAVQYSGSSPITTPAFTFTAAGNQTGECIGDFLLLAFSTSAAGNAAALSGNPWQLFRPRRVRRVVPEATGGDLNASAAGTDTASGSADLAAQVGLAAVGVAVAGASAQAGVAIPLSVTGFAVAAGQAGPQATITLGASGLAVAAAAAGLSASVLQAGAAAAQATGNAALAAQLNVLAAGAVQAGGNANLTGSAPGSLAAAGQGEANGSAALSVQIRLQATGAAQAAGTATGQASAPGQLSALGQANAGGWAAQSVLINLSAAGFVHAMAQGSLAIEVPLGAQGVASAAGLAQLGAAGPVRGARLEAGAPHLVTQAVAVAFAATTFEHGAEHV